MRLPARSAAWLLLLLLTGCIHKSKVQLAQVPPLAPQIDDSQSAKPEPAPIELPLPEVTEPVQTPAPEMTPAPQPAKKAPKHKKPATTTTQIASSGSPSVSAVGQLSSGDPSDMRQQTDGSILTTERTLNGITRGLSDQEQKTAAQIREYIKQARVALIAGDVDGAHNLAVKAKVLLDELFK
jgi:hypothetical protein